MAVGALHQAFVHTVMERPRELLLGLQMAAIAKLRLLFFHQKLRFLGMVWVVAIGATYIVLQVSGPAIVGMLFSVLMASEAACADFLCGSILKRENFGLVSAGIHVRFSRSVAGLAAVPCGSPLVGKRGVVRGILIIFYEVFRG